MPGDNIVEIEVDLIAPIAMEKGMRFAIRRGWSERSVLVLYLKLSSREN